MGTLLGLGIILFVLVIIFQLAKANEMVDNLKNDDNTGVEIISESTNRMQAVLFVLFLVFGMIGVFWSSWHYQDLYLPYPSSEHGAGLRTMFQWTLWATAPVFVATHIALFWFAYKYRFDKKAKAYFFPESHRLELIWTVIPAIVMIVLVVEGLRSWYNITGEASADAIRVEATAQQFKWTLRYAGADNDIGIKTVKNIKDDNPMGQDWSDAANKDDFIAEELHLPVGKEVLVKINSLDVLHNFYLPHFRVKMDAVPGIPTQFKFTPTITTEEMRKKLNNPDFNYELACAELCGQAHYNMRKVVVIEEQADYDKWFAEQKSLYDQYHKTSKGTPEP